MIPTTTRLQQRLIDRRAWFQNEWFVKWHHIGGERAMEIDQFNGLMARYSGIAFSGTPRDIYWQSIAQGLRKEIVDQFEWVEQAVRGYAPTVAIQAIEECCGLIIGFRTASAARLSLRIASCVVMASAFLRSRISAGGRERKIRTSISRRTR
jgi:hypothetical protein